MSLFSKVVRCMRTIAPLELADTTWDNVGVLVGKLKVLDCLVFLSLTRVVTLEPPFPATHSNKVFLTIDLTPQVLDEALSDPSVSSTVLWRLKDAYCLAIIDWCHCCISSTYFPCHEAFDSR